MPLTVPTAQPGELFDQFADTTGDGTGTRDAIGNYSAGGAGTTDFQLVPEAETVVHIFRLLTQIEVAANTAADLYGDQAALANGIQVLKLNADNSINRNYTNDETIKSNAWWSRYCYDVNYVTFPGAGNNFIDVRWTFARGGAPIKLRKGETFVIRLSDDFSGLVGHFFNLQGVLFT